MKPNVYMVVRQMAHKLYIWLHSSPDEEIHTYTTTLNKNQYILGKYDGNTEQDKYLHMAIKHCQLVPTTF